VRAERVRAQRDATRSPFREPAAPVAESGADAESRLLALHARHRRHLHVSGIEERLAASAEALAMAEASGSAEEAAYGHLWRIEALGQLGRRVELDGDQAGLRHAVRRLGQPVWEERLGLVRASLFLPEGRFADCAAAVAAIRGFLGLVMRSQLAVVAHLAHRARGLVQHRGSGTAVGHVRLGRDDLGAACLDITGPARCVTAAATGTTTS
jgi:hypothetical protein